MLKDAEVEGFFMRLNTPGDGMIGFDIDPADQVGLKTQEASQRKTALSRGLKNRVAIDTLL